METSSYVFHCMWLFTLSPSACDVKGTRCLYQVHTLVQPLSNCLFHILTHSRLMCIQCQNWSHPFAWITPFATADPVCRPAPHLAGESPSSTVNWCQCYLRLKIHKFRPALFTSESRCHIGGSVEHVWDDNNVSVPGGLRLTCNSPIHFQWYAIKCISYAQ